MRIRSFSIFLTAGLLIGLQGSLVAQSVTYLPSPPNSWTYPADINNNGLAVGYSYSMSTFRPQACSWNNGELNLLGGYESTFACAINDLDVAVGFGQAESATYEVPVMWVNGVAEELPTLGFGGSANDINNQGDVVGYVRSSEGGGLEPAVWRDGNLELLSTLEGKGGIASTIDEFGLIAGISYGSALENGFLPTQWTDGAPKALPVTFGTSYIGSLGVNKTGAGKTSGYVIETRLLENGEPYPIVVAVGWDGDSYRVLQKLNDNQSSWAFDVNEFGVFAGYSRDSQGVDVPVLWTDEGITRLPFAPELMARAVSLNEVGQVIGVDSTSFAVPVIWDLSEEGQLGMPNARGTRGSNVPLTVRATDGNNPVAGEQVTFQVNGAVVGTATTNRNGFARMMYRIPKTAPGKLGVTASMPGMPAVVRAIEVDTNRSSAGVAGTFNEETGKVELTASLNAIEPNKPIANGRVNFFMNGTRVASATTDSSGVARAVISVPANMESGMASLEARFAGNKFSRPVTGRSSVDIDQ